VPLNENEERILQEIERRFYAHDPESAKRISSTTLAKYLARNCRWAALGFIAGLVVLVVGFASSWVVGVVGFLVMVVSAVILVRNLRRMSRLGLEHMSRSLAGGNLGQAIDDAAKRFRRRLGRDED
jgi:Protein of unknown function (DUF3040)